MNQHFKKSTHGQRPGRFIAGVCALVLWSLAIPAQSAESEDDGDKFVKRAPEVSGYIQFHFNQPVGGAENRFRIHRARLTVEGEVSKRISYEMDIDPRAPDHAGTLRDAFFNIEFRPGHVLRLGQQKTKFGYINNRSSSRLYTVNRPELADELSRGLNLRDIGASLIISRPLSPGRDVEYWLSVVNGAGMNVQRDNNDAKNVFGRIGLKSKSDARKWRWGVSGAIGDKLEPSGNPLYADRGGYYIDFKRVGTDFQVDTDRIHVATEFLIGSHEDRGDKETVHGYYLTLAGKTSGQWGPVISYDSMNDTENVRVTVGGYHGKPNDDFRVLLNYEFRGAVDVGRFYIWTVVRI